MPRTVLDSLARSNQLLEAILAELRAARQVGAVYPISVTITGGQWVEHTFDPSLFALTIVNDGPANAEWRLPFQAPTAGIVILPTEVATISLNRALIRSVGLRVAVGTSNLRIVGIY